MNRDEIIAPEKNAPKSGTGKRTESGILAEDGVLDEELRQALGNFRLSVEAWSAAAYSRPRETMQVHGRRIGRLAVGWALGCALVVGAASGLVHEQHLRQEQARIAAAKQIERQRVAAEQQARDEEELLAKVDSDVSREVPNAMEPLAQLMAEDEAK
jgi:uncharacterized protein HemX